MTVNPVDMQVMIPQVDRINQVERGLQKQQQVEQQIIGQVIQDSLIIKKRTVQKTNHAEQKTVKNDSTKEDEKQGQESEKKKNQNGNNQDQSEAMIEKPGLGGKVDIKI